MRISSMLFGVSLLFFSCNPGPRKDGSHPPAVDSTPAALQSPSSSFIIKKRAPEDLVEDIYQELAKKDPELSNLETEIGSLPEKREKAASDYETYDDKNDSYYRSAAAHAGEIKDSVLKKKLTALIQDSQLGYDKTKVSWKELLGQVETQKTAVSDLYIALKLYKTLPVIQQYQQQQLPDPKGMQKVLEEYKSTKAKTTAIASKN